MGAACGLYPAALREAGVHPSDCEAGRLLTGRQRTSSSRQRRSRGVLGLRGHDRFASQRNWTDAIEWGAGRVRGCKLFNSRRMRAPPSTYPGFATHSCSRSQGFQPTAHLACSYRNLVVIVQGLGHAATSDVCTGDKGVGDALRLAPATTTATRPRRAQSTQQSPLLANTAPVKQ